MEEIQGGVAAALGFRASGVACGIKGNRKRDLAMVVSDKPAAACGVFTSNRMKAAPVVLSSSYIKAGRARSIVVNSGNANAATGPAGMEDAKRVSEEAAKKLGIPKRQSLVFSTGIIGKPLPVEKILSKMDSLIAALGRGGSSDAADAIMTTDTFSKEKAVGIFAGGAEIRIGAIAKGSGMIAPDMATMLCFISTDAAIERDALERALKYSVDRSFNSITVDGDCSTNDSVVILANGAARNAKIRYGTAAFREFRNALLHLCAELARMIVKDGEGATKLVEVAAEGAGSASSARKVCFAVANSLLVKTAVSGENPNWGRIVSAAGASGVPFDPARLTVSLGGRVVFADGAPVEFKKAELDDIMKSSEIRIKIDLGRGKGSWSVLTTDLSEEYVKINKEYS